MSDFFDSVGDLAGDIAGGIGDAAGAAFDFLAPTTERRGAGLGLSDLFAGLGDAAANTVVGGLTSLPDLLDSDTSLGEKFLWGGLMVGGAYMGARQFAAARKLESAMMPSPARMADSGGGIFRRMGLPERMAPSTPGGEAVLRRHPGLKSKTVDILGADDDLGAAQALTGHTDPFKVAHAAGLISTYGSRLVEIAPEGQLAAAQLDFAKIDLGLERKIIRSDELKTLWGSFKADPEAFSKDPARVERMMSLVQQVGDATRGIVEPDFTINPVVSVAKIDVSDAGTHVRLRAPLDWDAAGAIDPEVRSKRLKALNLRAITPAAKDRMKYLYRLGLSNEARYLDRGSDWYLNEHQTLLKEIEKAQDVMPWLNLDKLSAAVSLTSEATDWDQNVALAVRTLREVADDPRLQDPEFQQWLRSDADFPDRRKAAEFDRVFRAAHKRIAADNKLKVEEARKVFRLFSEDGPAVFGTTGGPKQKNFYLNLLDPTNDAPVTVDRHQIDIFFGVGTHSDFKVLETKDLGDGAYEILAETVRQTAAELSEELGVRIMPHQVQGVVWQTWRQLKKEYGYKTYDWGSTRGPFRLNEPDGSPNMVYEVLRGRPHPAVQDIWAQLPDNVIYSVGATGDGIDVFPDGSVRVAARSSQQNALRLRHLSPGFVQQDGVALWSASRPTPVRDVDEFLSRVDADVRGHEVEVWGADAFGGTHPALLPGYTAMVELPPGAKVGKGFRAVDPKQRAIVYGADGGPKTGPVEPSELTYENFISENSPLRTRQWAAISAAVDDEQAARFGLAGYDNAARHAELGEALRRAGYDPIEQRGVYGGEPEPSYLVFGITPAEALRFGDMFHQDAVITNDHMWYGKTAKNRSHAGTAQEFDPDEIRVNVDDEDYISITEIDGREVRWTTAYDWESPHVKADPSRPATGKRLKSEAQLVAVKLKPEDLEDPSVLRARLEQSGAVLKRVYAPQAPPKGWALAREHVYSDGVRTMVVRSTDNEVASPNGVHVWVPEEDAARLPRKNPLGQRFHKRLVEPSPIGNSGMFSLGGLAVTDSADILKKKSGVILVEQGPVPKLTWTAEAPTDETVQILVRNGEYLIAEAEETAQAALDKVNLLGALGVDPKKVHVQIGPEPTSFDYVPPPAPKGGFSTSWSADMPAVRRASSPRPDWHERYNVEFYAQYHDRGTGKLVELPAGYEADFEPILAGMFSDPDRSRMVRLVTGQNGALRIGPGDWREIDGFKGNEVAWTTSAPTTEIVLNMEHWADPSEVAGNVATGYSTGYYARTVDGPGAMLAHELGHVMHYALRASFPTVGGANEFDTKVLGALKKSMKGKALKQALSSYGASNLQEFMAESLAEAVFSPSPRPLAVQVYNTVMDQFRKNAEALPEGTVWKEAM